MNKKIDAPQLYRTALRVFARYGFSKTKMADVARELDLVAGTLYRYVSDKKDLYHKSVAHGLRQWQSSAMKAYKDYDDPMEQLVVFTLMGYQYLESDRDLLAIMVENPAFLSTSLKDDPFQPISAASIRMVQDILDRGMELGRFRKVDSQGLSETFFTLYMLFVIKRYLRGEGQEAWGKSMGGFEVVLLGIASRNVDEDYPMKLLEKHRGILQG